MKSVLLLASYPGSIIKFRGALIDKLVSLGLEVHVAAPKLIEHKCVADALLQKGVFIHNVSLSRTGISLFSDGAAFIGIARLMASLRPDALFAYTIKPVIYGLLAGRLFGIQQSYALITGLGYAFTGSAKGQRLVIQFIARSLYKFSLRYASLVFFQNPDDEALFRRLGLLSPKTKSKIINGSGINLKEFCVASLPLAPKFLLIARLLKDKGVREYAAAAAIVKQRYPDISFRIVGDVDSNPESISRDELYGWVESGCVEYLGQLDDVRPAISDSSVYVLPSYREGTPRTVLEAMAMGRPVITTDAPGCRETLVEGVNGFLVPVKSVDRLAEAMIKFIEQPELISKMGEQSRKIAEEKYDVDEVNKVILDSMGIL